MVWVLGRTTFDMCLDCRLRDLGWTQPSFSLEKHLPSLPTLGLRSGFRCAQGFLFCGQMIFTQGDSRAWKAGIVLSWRACRRAERPAQGIGVPGSWSPWTLAECLMPPHFSNQKQQCHNGALAVRSRRVAQVWTKTGVEKQKLNIKCAFICKLAPDADQIRLVLPQASSKWGESFSLLTQSYKEHMCVYTSKKFYILSLVLI